MSTRAFLLATAIALLAIAGVYTTSLGYGVAHDDLIAYQDPILAFDLSWAFSEYRTHGLWIPAVWLDFMATTKVFGAYLSMGNAEPDSIIAGVNPVVLHAGNIIQHTINAILLMFVVMNLTGKRFIAVIAGLLWMAHPVQLDTVALIAERKNTLSMMFMLASLLAYQSFSVSRRLRTMALCFGFFVLAALSKPTTLMLPIIFLVLDAYRVEFDFRKLSIRNVIEKLPFFIVSFVVGVKNLEGQTLAAPRTPGDFETGLANFATYVLHVIFPVGLSQTAPEYGSELQYLAAAGAGVFFVLLMIVFFVVLAAAKYRDLLPRNADVVFGIAWFLVFLVPALNIAMVIGTSPTYDHNLYIPLAGLAFAAAALFNPLTTGTLVIVFAVLSASQIHRWDHHNEAEFMKAFTTHAYGQLQVCARESDPAAAVRCIDGVLAKTKYVWQRQKGLAAKVSLMPAGSPQQQEAVTELAKVQADIWAFESSRWWIRLSRFHFADLTLLH